MILFNYALSPYAEKIRLMLGCSGLSWVSVKVPPMPPRKGLDELTGGYNRIPVAQIGADIFCDTRLITTEIARLAGRPEFSLDTCGDDIANFASTIEREKFFPAVRSAPQKAMLVRALREHLPTTLVKLMKDRAKMGRASKVKMPGVEASKAIYAAMLAELDQQLANRGDKFLFGDAPSIADFSAYHLIWFNAYLGKQAVPSRHGELRRWYARMSGFGHGNVARKPMRYALAQAQEQQPREIASEDLAQGKPRVTVSPDDYRLDPVEGVLVGERADRWVIARNLPSGAQVHVHFPKQGFAIGEGV